MTGEWFLIVYMTVAGVTTGYTQKHDSELSCFLHGRVEEHNTIKRLKNKGDTVIWSCGQKIEAVANIHR